MAGADVAQVQRAEQPLVEGRGASRSQTGVNVKAAADGALAVHTHMQPRCARAKVPHWQGGSLQWQGCVRAP